MGVADDVTHERLRALAGVRAPEGARVLSVYVNLDPRQFATPDARATEIDSLLDEADRRARDADGALDHAGRTGLRRDVDRVRAFFSREFSAKGARGLALFACGAIDLFDALRLPCPVPHRVAIAGAPVIEPLAAVGPPTRWCVLLVNKRHGRALAGTRYELQETGDVYDWVPGRAREGGLSEMRYERSVDEAARHHFEHVAEAMLQLLKRRPFDRLLVGAPEPEHSEVVDRLHPYVREKLAGRVEVDVEHATPEQVLAAAAEPMARDAERRAAAALDRLRAGIGRGDGAVHGGEAVRAALEQQRVEVLLYDDRADGALEDAVRAAVLQAAEVVNLGDAEDLAPLGHIAAVLRF
jgi:peptide chain release factor subunit 1